MFIFRKYINLIFCQQEQKYLSEKKVRGKWNLPRHRVDLARMVLKLVQCMSALTHITQCSLGQRAELYQVTVSCMGHSVYLLIGVMVDLRYLRTVIDMLEQTRYSRKDLI